jgi:hypothetical protein
MKVDLESAATLAGVDVTTFKSFRPEIRASYANKVQAGHAMPIPSAKLDRVAMQRDLQGLERQAAKLAALPTPRYSNGQAQVERTRQHIIDRAAGLRRRLEQP